MRRDTARLADRPFDVLVVGAGIYGACIARDAAQRGLRTALIERDDFGALTSHNSFKLVHGGLRYLQQLDLSRLRQSAREQRIWLHIAPHLVEPLAFVMPTFGHGSRGPEALRLALLAYEWLSRGGAPATPRVPPGRVVGKAEARRLLPGLDRPEMNGAAIWHDVQMLGADRLLLECVIDAEGEGAVVANHVEAEGWLGDAQRITGVRARDRLSNETFEIRAELTINAAGPFAGNLAENLPSRPPAAFGGLSQGLNLVVRRALTQDHAIAVSSRRRSNSLVPRADGRLFFIQPWQGLSLIGTSHLPYPGEPGRFAFDEAWLEDFLAEVNDAYPPAALTRDDVLYAYAGLTPAAKEPRGSEVQRTRRGRRAGPRRGARRRWPGQPAGGQVHDGPAHRRERRRPGAGQASPAARRLPQLADQAAGGARLRPRGRATGGTFRRDARSIWCRRCPGCRPWAASGPPCASALVRHRQARISSSPPACGTRSRRRWPAVSRMCCCAAWTGWHAAS